MPRSRTAWWRWSTLTAASTPFLACLLLSGCAEGVLETDWTGGPPPPRCSTDGDCALPLTCAARGRCIAPEPRVDGASCRHDDHCRGGRCMDLGTGLVCMTLCEGPGGCGEGAARCVPTVGLRASAVVGAGRGADGGVSSDASSPGDSGEQPDSAGSGDAGTGVDAGAAPSPVLAFLCRSAGDGDRHLGEGCLEDTDCRSGFCQQQRCSQACGACPATFECRSQPIARGKASGTHDVCLPSSPLVVQQLGGGPAPVAGGEPLSFDLPAGVGSFVVYAQGDPSVGIAVRRLEGPDGAVVFDLEQPETGSMRTNFPVPGVSAALVPGSDAAELVVAPGTYKVWAATYDYPKFIADLELERVEGTVEQLVVAYRADGGVGGLLDLNIHLAPGTGLNAQSAAEDSFVRRVLARMDSVYTGQLGIGIGRVAFFNLSASENVLSSGGDALSLFATFSKPGAGAGAVNLFWVQDMSFASGFSGGIPGVPDAYGLPGSGVAVDAQRSAEALGTLVAHEIGHFLGLWHTTDTNGRLDPIGDTPVCSDAIGTGCPDARNLMFPLVPASGDLDVSPGQRRVARANPLLYQLSYPDACGAGVSVIDVSQTLFASGSTRGGQDIASGFCGGAEQPERIHLLRLGPGVETLEVGVQSGDFTPAIYAQQGACGADQIDMACAPGADGTATLRIRQPAEGAYYLFVDGLDGSGEYTLTVEQTLMPEPAQPPKN